MCTGVYSANTVFRLLWMPKDLSTCYLLFTAENDELTGLIYALKLSPPCSAPSSARKTSGQLINYLTRHFRHSPTLVMNNPGGIRPTSSRPQMRTCAIIMTILTSSSFILSTILGIVAVTYYKDGTDDDFKATTAGFMFLYAYLSILMYYIFETLSGLSTSSHIAVSRFNES